LASMSSHMMMASQMVSIGPGNTAEYQRPTFPPLPPPLRVRIRWVTAFTVPALNFMFPAICTLCLRPPLSMTELQSPLQPTSAPSSSTVGDWLSHSDLSSLVRIAVDYSS
jgi:hypothetical protein